MTVAAFALVLLAAGGALLVATSVFLFARAGATGGSGRRGRGIAFGLVTGALIAVYTVWDKYAVATLLVAPIVMEWATSLARVVLLAPIAIAQWPTVRETWARHRAEALGIGLLNPLSYLLVMIAMITTPVAYLAPLREVSILIGAVMGARVQGGRRPPPVARRHPDGARRGGAGGGMMQESRRRHHSLTCRTCIVASRAEP